MRPDAEDLALRALLVALLHLAIDDRPLHLKAATRLLYCSLSTHWRTQLEVVGEASTKKSLLARYRWRGTRPIWPLRSWTLVRK